jgi:hypothetical protein
MGTDFSKLLASFCSPGIPGKVVKPFHKIPNGFDASEKRSTWGVKIKGLRLLLQAYL